MTIRGIFLAAAVAMAAIVPSIASHHAIAATAQDLHRDADQALKTLYSTSPVAEAISKKARAVLVFPTSSRLGSCSAEATAKACRVIDYYNSVTGSFRFQAGAQSYSYAVFLMNDEAVEYLRTSEGSAIGVGPTVVVVNKGAAKNLPTSTLQDDAYALIFSQQELMSGVSIEGTTISTIQR